MRNTSFFVVMLAFSCLMKASIAYADLSAQFARIFTEEAKTEIFTAKEWEQFEKDTNSQNWPFDQWLARRTFNPNELLNASPTRLAQHPGVQHPLIKTLTLLAQKELESPRNIWVPLLRTEVLLQTEFSTPQRDSLIEYIPKILGRFPKDQRWVKAILTSAARYKNHSSRRRDLMRYQLLQECLIDSPKDIESEDCKTQAIAIHTPKVRLYSARTQSPGQEVLTVSYQNATSIDFEFFKIDGSFQRRLITGNGKLDSKQLQDLQPVAKKDACLWDFRR